MSFQESWQRTREHLLEARKWVPADLILGVEGGSIASFEEYLDHNELQLAMEELASIANSHPVPLSFWRQMHQAAEEMQLEEASVRYASLSVSPS